MRAAHIVAVAVAVTLAPALARAQDPILLAIPTYATIETPSAAQYARTVTNKTISAAMTRAVMPALTGEDPRYDRRGEGSAFGRLAYAASRSVVTRTRSGALTFNISEVAGTATAAGLSNIYYSPADRTAGGTLARWGTQIMWDTAANELREFWPDIRAKFHR